MAIDGHLEASTAKLNAPEYVMYKQQSDTLVVWFGGINEPFISDKLAKIGKFDLIGVLDSNYSWYTRGILNGHTSIEEGEKWLNGFTCKYRRVIFCGQSSGGYGALLYAQTCGAHACICFSPQTRNMFSGQNGMVPNIPLQDLRQIYKKDSSVSLIFNLSRSEKDHEDSFFWDDWRHVEYFRDKNYSTFIVHPFDNHSVSTILREKNKLWNLVVGIVTIYGPTT